MEGVLQMKKLKDLPNHRSNPPYGFLPQAKNITEFPTVEI